MVDETVLASKIASVGDALAMRLAAASGLRNLVAHQYGILDWRRVFTLASERLDDLLAFCAQLADRAREPRHVPTDHQAQRRD
jgi:uncharacterized protein YutE (UPF0331/DUF86 family)